MMKTQIALVALLIVFLLLASSQMAVQEKKTEYSEPAAISYEKNSPEEKPEKTIYIPQNYYVTVNVYEPYEPEEAPKPDMELTDEEIDLIALVTIGEAEGEEELGKRLVIDAILNRVDSLYFPNTVKEVIYQTGQFTCVRNGRLVRCKVTEPVRELVKNEAFRRINHDVIFFTAGGYGKYGKPMFKEGNHYFCSY